MSEIIPNSEFYPISTPWGHFRMLGLDPADKEFIEETIRELLEESG